MMGFGRTRVGLTIDQSGIQYVKLVKNKVWELEASGGLMLPEGAITEDQFSNTAAIAPILKEWVQKEKLAGEAVSIAVPTSQLIVRKMHLPSHNAKELRSLVELEVETTLHLPFENPVYDYVEMEADESGTQVLVFAAPRKWVDTAVLLLEEAGLKVKDAQIASFALVRAIRRNPLEPLNETMLIHLDDASMEIYMFYAGYPVFMRSINLSENQDYRDHQGLIGDSQTAELTAEIARMLNFYQFGIQQGESKIAAIWVTGASASRSRLVEAIRASQQEITVSEAEYVVQLRDGGDMKPVSGLNGIAAGLVIQGSDKNASLLPRKAADTKLFPVLIYSSLALWLAAAGVIGYMAMSYHEQKDENAQEIIRLEGERAMLEERFSSAGRENQANPAAVIEQLRANRRDAPGIVRLLENALPKGGIMKSLTYTAEGNITVAGTFSTLTASAKYLDSIRKLPQVKTALLDTVTKETTLGSPDGEQGAVRTAYAAVYSIVMKRVTEGEVD
ncbi:pilus assembly protein PilM [Paenibacillus tarimensis]|nr:pilus assembly protein PilM [Paenibacillus tarimensis]MCF2943431.1 pilus assembly protein PilM [Paenibacillus tarimensis]